MKLKNLVKSYGFWTALAGATVALVNAIGRACGFFVEEEIISNIIMSVAGLLVVFGIVALPKKDKEENNGVDTKGDVASDNDEFKDET